MVATMWISHGDGDWPSGLRVSPTSMGRVVVGAGETPAGKSPQASNGGGRPGLKGWKC